LMPIPTARGPVDEFARDMLRQYCEAWQMRAVAVLNLKAEGELLDRGPNGARYPKPYFKVIEQAERTMDRVFRRLNLGEGKDARSELVAFLAGDVD
jgi:phage terminase small subunit